MLHAASSSETTANVCTATVAQDLCAGCGVCAGVCPAGNLRMGWNAFGQLAPVDQGKCLPGCSLCLDVCPFQDHDENEDTLAASQFGAIEGVQHTHETGYFLGAFVGHAHAGHRERGASGGLASWFLSSLLEQKLVDYVLCVGKNSDPHSLFVYKECANTEEVRAAASSKYYPVEISQALARILEKEGRCAVIGLPCTLKALRLAARLDSRLRSRIVFMAGLVCGQAKSRCYAEYIAAKAGADCDRIMEIDFRGKRPDRPASNFEFRVRDMKGPRVYTMEYFGFCSRVWNSGMFTPQSCLFCDDVFAETADIAFMDAWLPEYKLDSQGTSIVLARSRAALDILQAGIDKANLKLQPLGIDCVISSQKGALEVKREILQRRLAVVKSSVKPAPRKRIAPRRPNWPLRELIRARMALRLKSHQAWQAHKPDIKAFEKSIEPSMKRYERIVRLRNFLLRLHRFARSPLKVLIRVITSLELFETF